MAGHISHREIDNMNNVYQDAWAEAMISRKTNTPTTILDMCCGDCSLYDVAKKLFKHVDYTGVDISDGLIKWARKKNAGDPLFRAFVADAQKYKDGHKYDMIVFKGGLHHLKDFKSAITNAKDMLTADGELVVSEPISYDLVKYLRMSIYKHMDFPEQHAIWEYDDVFNMISREGLVITKVERFGLLAYPFGFQGRIPFLKLIPNFIKRFMIRLDNTLLRMPIINRYSMAVIITAKKEPKYELKGGDFWR